MQICQDLAQEPWNLEMRFPISGLSINAAGVFGDTLLCSFLGLLTWGYAIISSLHGARSDDQARKDVTYSIGTWVVSNVR
jgi:hypothetical protein